MPQQRAPVGRPEVKFAALWAHQRGTVCGATDLLAGPLGVGHTAWVDYVSWKTRGANLFGRPAPATPPADAPKQPSSGAAGEALALPDACVGARPRRNALLADAAQALHITPPLQQVVATRPKLIKLPTLPQALRAQVHNPPRSPPMPSEGLPLTPECHGLEVRLVELLHTRRLARLAHPQALEASWGDAIRGHLDEPLVRQLPHTHALLQACWSAYESHYAEWGESLGDLFALIRRLKRADAGEASDDLRRLLRLRPNIRQTLKGDLRVAAQDGCKLRAMVQRFGYGMMLTGARKPMALSVPHVVLPQGHWLLKNDHERMLLHRHCGENLGHVVKIIEMYVEPVEMAIERILSTL